MLPTTIKKPADLITSQQATVDGFIAQAIEKCRIARPYVQQAQQLRESLNQSTDIHALIINAALRDQLLAAAGLSDKARHWLSDDQQDRSLDRILGQLAAAGGDQWRDEILFRFLLTRGDSLGGAMRNITGAAAGRKLVASIIKALAARQIKPQLTKSPAGKVQYLRWPSRLLAFDKTPRFVGNNIDAILLRVDDDSLPDRDVLESPDSYLACGELKGGIDPSGADEHWKTADSALDRIREVFRNKQQVHMFFAGAAIEDAMAKEIYQQLLDGRMSFAANLTIRQQLSELAAWLVRL